MLDRNSPDIIALTNAILRSENLEQIAVKAATVLGNPVAIVDSAYNLIAWSHESVPDETWQNRIKDGHWDYDFVAMVRQIMDKEGLDGRRSVVISDAQQLHQRVDSLVLRGSLLGYLMVLESENKLNSLDEDVYLHVRDLLTKAVGSERCYEGYTSNNTRSAVMLRDLLHMRFPDSRLFHERIRGSEFDRKTIFQVLALRLEQYDPKMSGGEKLNLAIQRLLPASWSCYDAQHVVILFDRTATLHKDANALARFEDFLRDNKLTAGLSSPFADLFQLAVHHRQSTRVLEIVRDFAPRFLFPTNSPIEPYEDCKILDLVTLLPQDKCRYFCHSDILNIVSAAQDRADDILRTVFAYLSAGKSIHAAAAVLHVHHNTVYYRINKIKELFGLDFTSEQRNVHYCISCMILLYTL